MPKLTIQQAQKKKSQHEKKVQHYQNIIDKLSRPVIGFKYPNKK